MADSVKTGWFLQIFVILLTASFFPLTFIFPNFQAQHIPMDPMVSELKCFGSSWLIFFADFAKIMADFLKS